MFQFEYLNRNKMAGLKRFLEAFALFHQALPAGYQYCLEIRNPNYLQPAYYDFLASRHLGHVFLQGYYMPSIFDLYERFKKRLSEPVVIRLHGMDRQGMEERTNSVWDTIVDPRDDELPRLASMVKDALGRGHQVYLNVNNHYEGCAPRTIERIKTLLQME
jgi:uncharacterized protein YecE (DUF72 family)